MAMGRSGVGEMETKPFDHKLFKITKFRGKKLRKNMSNFSTSILIVLNNDRITILFLISLQGTEVLRISARDDSSQVSI